MPNHGPDTLFFVPSRDENNAAIKIGHGSTVNENVTLPGLGAHSKKVCDCVRLERRCQVNIGTFG